ncbi:hypothetical protein CASFOL_019523 [Castilleja foliolosa]|uniref:Uncharacterized protein n=1 Tax=Castilleja foliolosa TaxID=1961234 RepID=A0ABD3D7N7_9LAMI
MSSPPPSTYTAGHLQPTTAISAVDYPPPLDHHRQWPGLHDWRCSPINHEINRKDGGDGKAENVCSSRTRRRCFLPHRRRWSLQSQLLTRPTTIWARPESLPNPAVQSESRTLTLGGGTRLESGVEAKAVDVGLGPDSFDPDDGDQFEDDGDRRR